MVCLVHTGPGSYNVTNGFDKIKRDAESLGTLQGFGLEQLGVLYSKPGTSFASQVKRLKGSELDTAPHVDIPGPGQYHKEQSWVKNRMGSTQWNKSSSMGWTRVTTQH